MAAVADSEPAPKRLRLAGKVSPFYADLLESVGREMDLNQRVYLVTISRVLPGSAGGEAYRDLRPLSRKDVGHMVQDAFDTTLSSAVRLSWLTP